LGGIRRSKHPCVSSLPVDALDRLIKSTGSFGRTYDYDATGNRLLDKKGTTLTTTRPTPRATDCFPPPMAR